MTKYAEPCLGWNDEDFKVGLTKYGIAEYAAPTKMKIEAPRRPPEITFELRDPEPVVCVLEDRTQGAKLQDV